MPKMPSVHDTCRVKWATENLYRSSRAVSTHLLHSPSNAVVADKRVENKEPIHATVDGIRHPLPASNKRIDLSHPGLVEARLEAGELLLPLVLAQVRAQNDHDFVPSLAKGKSWRFRWPFWLWVIVTGGTRAGTDERCELRKGANGL